MAASTVQRPGEPVGQNLVLGEALASCVGEHLGCNPCGRLACVIGVTVWPVPEVLLSLLPGKLDYTIFKVSNSSISDFFLVSRLR